MTWDLGRYLKLGPNLAKSSVRRRRRVARRRRRAVRGLWWIVMAIGAVVLAASISLR
jgi:hypothetical protein